MAGKNTVTKEVAINQIFPDILRDIDVNSTWSQGDYLIFDTANGAIRAATGEAEGAYGLGIATQDLVAGKLVSPYSTANDAAISPAALNGPIYGCVAKMVLKTGTSMSNGAVVYLDIATGKRGVAASGTKAIGMYEGAGVTASAAGLEIEVLIGARYPNDTLKF